MKHLTLEKFVDWMQDYRRDKSVTEDSLIEDDMGITGDDGTDLLLDIEKEFDISFLGNDGSIREAFNLQPNEYLFHSEGVRGIFDFLFKPKEIVKPLTVRQLYEVIISLSS